jgi:hypothetical protein
MDTTLVTVTLLSMAMAASLSVIVWRMLRDDRRRSEARVLALTAMAARPPAGERRDRAEPPAAAPAALNATGVYELGAELPLRPRAERGAEGTPRALGGASTHDVTLFAERDVASPWGHRFAVMGGLGLVIASVILISLTASGRNAERRPPAGGSAAAPQGTVIGLELLSLRDARQAGALTITGLVHNPHDGATLAGVTVTAYAFDDKGAFLASGRAAIDVTALAPGDESPFVVSVPTTETVARYRIGFRGEDGRVIAHIDKRQQPAVAALRLSSGQVNWQ